MTTIGATIKDQPKKATMGKKRIFINTEHLASAVEAIRQEINNVIQPAIQELAMVAGRVPYRLKGGFHQSEISQILDSALMLLHKDMKTISNNTWREYLAHYLAIPTDNATTGQQPGVVNIIFYDDDSNGLSMIQLADEIAEYIDAFVNIRIPYLIMGGNTSYKIVGTLALIHAEAKLKKASNNDSVTSEEVS